MIVQPVDLSLPASVTCTGPPLSERGSGPPPAITSGGIVVANLLPTISSISPNAIISIFGTDLADEGIFDDRPELDSEGRVAINQSGICVEINRERSPMFVVSTNQLNLQAPTLQARGPVTVEVIAACDTANEKRSPSQMVTVEDVTPAFFTISFTNADGANPIAALHGGGPEVVADPAVFPGTRPAQPGEFISLFATGFGPTDPPIQAGEIPATALAASNGQARVTGAFSITIAGIPLPEGDVFYAGTAPCCAGLYQLVVKVPEAAADGNQSVVATVDGVSTPTGPFVTVARSSATMSSVGRSPGGPAVTLDSRTTDSKDRMTANGGTVLDGGLHVFASNALAAALIQRVTAGGSRSVGKVFSGGPAGRRTPVPIDLGPQGDHLYLLLFASGVPFGPEIRVKMGGEDAEVVGVASSSQFAGVGQVNVRVPRSLTGRGKVDVELTVGGIPANTVTITVL